MPQPADGPTAWDSGVRDKHACPQCVPIALRVAGRNRRGESAATTAGVLLLRLLAARGVAAAVAAAVAVAVPARRPLVLALTALNPIAPLHLVGGAHVVAILAGVVGLAALSLVRGRHL